MIELCCEYLSVRCICLYVIILSRTSFRVQSVISGNFDIQMIDTRDSSIHDEIDPNFNFYQDIPSFDKYYSPPEVKQSSKNFSEDEVSIFHVSIRSMKKNFENFIEFYYALDFRFSIICFSETWADNSFRKNSVYQLKNYNVKEKIKKWSQRRRTLFLCSWISLLQHLQRFVH